MARIGLAQVPGKLAEHTGKPAPKYRAVYDAAVEGRIPAQFAGRWSIDEVDLPKIAAAMGLSPTKPVRAARKAAAAPVSVAA